jgi:hypothetical protein
MFFCILAVTNIGVTSRLETSRSFRSSKLCLCTLVTFMIPNTPKCMYITLNLLLLLMLLLLDAKTTLISSWACEQPCTHNRLWNWQLFLAAVELTTAFISVWACEQPPTTVCRTSSCSWLLLNSQQLSFQCGHASSHPQPFVELGAFAGCYCTPKQLSFQRGQASRHPQPFVELGTVAGCCCTHSSLQDNRHQRRSAELDLFPSAVATT